MIENLNHNNIPKKLIGKIFGEEGLKAVKEVIQTSQPFTREEVARQVCKRLEWLSPGGRYQVMSAKVGLLRLHRQGLIKLPPPTGKNGNGSKLKLLKITLPEKRPVGHSAGKLPGLKLLLVEDPKQSALYNALIDIYHYLGYSPMAGAQIRYLFRWNEGVLGCIGFGASAWKLAPRDRFIGWESCHREKNLHLIVNNWRFLILPWVHSKNLASKILSMCAKRIPGDFVRIYGYTPVLLETFVEKNRFHGYCYRAANWQCVGETQGRGKKHQYKQPRIPIKDIWIYPLSHNFRHILKAENTK